MSCVPKIYVIIPIHDNETAHQNLISFFESLNDPDFKVIVSSGKNRANAMNKGVKDTSDSFLWFVHADTNLTIQHVNDLKNSLKQYPDSLHYFDLIFAKDGPFLTKLNSIGANIRSQIFGLPWGDQALCLSNKIFQDLGGYDETLPYGEDHILVWNAHHNKIKLSRITRPLQTSARQYQKKGWLFLTIKRQYLWLKQAIPELIKLIKIRILS